MILLFWVLSAVWVVSFTYIAWRILSIWLDGIKHRAWMDGLDEGHRVCNEVVRDLNLSPGYTPFPESNTGSRPKVDHHDF